MINKSSILLQECMKRLKDMNLDEQTEEILFVKNQIEYLIIENANSLKNHLEGYIKILKKQYDLSLKTLKKMNDFILELNNKNLLK